MSKHDCGNCVHCDDKLICDMTGKYVDNILLCPF